MSDGEDVVRVYPADDGQWCVKPEAGTETRYTRKALASLHAKKLAATGKRNGRVIFHKIDGTVEFECTYQASIQPRSPDE